jgi:hypothetical protein
MNLLETFESLLEAWRPVFRQERTFNRAHRLTFGLLCCLRGHLITNAICAMGRQFVDWSADFRVPSRSAWSAHRLFDVIFDRVRPLLKEENDPVVMGLDDTIRKKTGRKIPGTSILRDPQSPPYHVNLIRGMRFVQASLLIIPKTPGPARGLPVRFEPAPLPPKPRKKASAEAHLQYREQKKACCLSRVGAKVIAEVRHCLDQFPDTKNRQLITVVDGSYTNRTVLTNLPQRTTLIGRIRRDACSHYSLPLGSKGRRLYGAQAPTPEQLLKDPSFPSQTVSCFIAGAVRKLSVKTIAPVFWRKAGPSRPLRVVAISPVVYHLTKDSGSRNLRQPAFLICTDVNLPLEALIQAYVYRWEIECNHRDEKSFIGVGQGQVRSEQAVCRLPQLQVAAYSLLLLSALLTYGFDRSADFLPLPKWRRRRPIRPSVLDLLNLLRAQLFQRALTLSSSIDHFDSSSLSTTKSPIHPITPTRLALDAA